MSLAFTFVDLLTVAVVGVSAAYAVYRGFVSETLSVFAWAAAAFASLYLGPSVAPLLKSMIASVWLADIVAYALVFVAVVIPISFASFRFTETVKRSPVGPVDRALGFVFGVLRGLAIVGIAYLAFTALIPIRAQPSSVRDARLLPLIQSSSEILLALVPDRERNPFHRSQEDPAQGEQRQSAQAIPRPQPKPHVAERPIHRHAKKSSGAEDRRGLDKLIEATGSGDGNP